MSQQQTEHAGQNMAPKDQQFLEEHGDELSPSTKRARLIRSPEDHEDHPGQTLATRTREVIQHWAKERGAEPATVEGTEHDGRPGVLRFIFRDEGDSKLKKISWDEWFKPFEERNLVFLFQEHLKNGKQSNFFHMDNPDREHD
jgi:hypothetical protein